MEGEEGESDDPHSFVRQRLRTRLTILLAGVAMNILLAFVIFTGIALLADPVANVAHRPGRRPTARRRRSACRAASRPARTRRAIRPYDDSGDMILAIDGKQFPIFDRIDTPDAVAAPTCARTPASR